MSSESAYIAFQRAEEEASAARVARLGASVHAIREAPLEKLPPISMMQKIGSHSADHFRRDAAYYFDEIARRLLLDGASKVLDLGCGCGRMAIPFVDFLDRGRLYGCDVWADGVAWCEANLTGRDNAEFHLQPAANNYYFERFDEQVRNAFTLPWLGDGVLDASYAISVFTHLIYEDAFSYLKEINRATKPGGLGYFTFFVIDKYFVAYRDRTGHHTALAQRQPGCFHAYEGQDFFGGFTHTVLRSLFEQTGWEVVTFETGSWAEKPGARSYQDTFVVQKKA